MALRHNGDPCLSFVAEVTWVGLKTLSQVSRAWLVQRKKWITNIILIKNHNNDMRLFQTRQKSFKTILYLTL